MADVTNLVLSDAERMSTILSLFGPGVDQVTFLGLTLRVYHSPDVAPEQGAVLIQELQRAFANACRGAITPEYFLETVNITKVIIVVYFQNEVHSFIMFDYDPDSKSGYINLVCSKKEPISLGSFLLCITHAYLFNGGFDKVYLDASDDQTARYYDSIGYLYGKEPCGVEDEITEEHLIYKSGEDDGSFYEFLPEDYVTQKGYRMKLCGNYGGICINAYQKIREILRAKGMLN